MLSRSLVGNILIEILLTTALAEPRATSATFHEKFYFLSPYHFVPSLSL